MRFGRAKRGREKRNGPGRKAIFGQRLLYSPRLLVNFRSMAGRRRGYSMRACIGFVRSILPLLKATVELEKLDECRTDDFSLGGFVSCCRLDVSDVVSQFFELSSVDIAL